MSAAIDVQQHLHALDAEAAGAVKTWFFTPRDGACLLVGAAAGDAWARGMLRAISECIRRIREAPKRRPILCACCPAPVRTAAGGTFIVITPYTDAPRHGMGAVLCPACAARPDVAERVLAALQQVWPDLREVQPVSGPGRVQ